MAGTVRRRYELEERKFIKGEVLADIAEWKMLLAVESTVGVFLLRFCTNKNEEKIDYPHLLKSFQMIRVNSVFPIELRNISY